MKAVLILYISLFVEVCTVKKLNSLLLVLLISATFCAAQAQKGSWGLLFDISDAFNVNAFKDGYQVGAGCKYYIQEDLDLRALVGIDHVTAENILDEKISTTSFALGASVAKHLKTGPVSPYLGGLLGIRTLSVTDQPSLFDFYFGALFGVEFKLYQNLSLFAEYNLVASIDDDGFSVQMGDMKGTGQGALFGLIVYF